MALKEKAEKWIQRAKFKKGAFTKYSGGKVTEEDIKRGKNSPDKKVKKQAVAAEVLRRMAKKKRA